MNNYSQCSFQKPVASGGTVTPVSKGSTKSAKFFSLLREYHTQNSADIVPPLETSQQIPHLAESV
jgi:hypothetical protein